MPSISPAVALVVNVPAVTVAIVIVSIAANISAQRQRRWRQEGEGQGNSAFFCREALPGCIVVLAVVDASLSALAPFLSLSPLPFPLPLLFPSPPLLHRSCFFRCHLELIVVCALPIVAATIVFAAATATIVTVVAAAIAATIATTVALLSLRWHSCCAALSSFHCAGWFLPVALPLLLESSLRVPLLADCCVCHALPWWCGRQQRQPPPPPAIHQSLRHQQHHDPRFPDFLPCVALDLWKKGRQIGKFGEILIRETILGSIQMESVILNNCAIIYVDMKHIVLFYFVSALFSQVQGNAGQVGYIPPLPSLSPSPLLFPPLPLPSSSSATTITIAIALFLAISIATWPKTMPHIAMLAWQTRMPGNAVAARQMTMPHIKVVARRKISWLLRCLPLLRPLVLLLCRSLAAPAGCCVAFIKCCCCHQTPPTLVSIVHRRHCCRCRCHQATTATTANEITIIYGQRKRQQQHHHHQRTNGSTNVKTFTSPDDLDLFYLPTVTRECSN
jgi:hypothetical protein